MDGAVAIVTMAKPPHNLLNGAFIEGLLQAFEGAAESGARSILLKSSMKHFSAGADVDGLAQKGAMKRPQLRYSIASQLFLFPQSLLYTV